jgi:alkanesulfonate monooxygenase SsuD/methylene tetrahydromethanopterin reductase-like flavin-dependent oxidoreductase (luciferase family)
MAAMTMDHLSGGRFVLGLGVSGPQVVEGWYGEPFGKPLARTREYVSIVRDVVARREPVTSDGAHYPLPANGREGATGLGKPLKSTLRPLREGLPIYLGAEGPRNIALTAEIADGWLALFYSLTTTPSSTARAWRRASPGATGRTTISRYSRRSRSSSTTTSSRPQT